MCLDPGVAIENTDKPPPIYLCVDCVDQLRNEQVQDLVDILQPLGAVGSLCENKVRAHHFNFPVSKSLLY
jgi:hypothetical protein